MSKSDKAVSDGALSAALIEFLVRKDSKWQQTLTPDALELKITIPRSKLTNERIKDAMALLMSPSL